MYVITSNEKNSLTSEERRADAAAVFDALPAIVMWQEIVGEERHDDIRAVEPSNYTHVFPDIPNPVSVPNRFEVRSERWVQTLDPATDGGDNARFFATLRLRDTSRVTLKDFYLINTHFTAGADWDNPVPGPATVATRERWDRHFDQVQAEILRIKNLGFTVFWGGDFNRQEDTPEFARNQKIAIGRKRVDKLIVLDRSVKTSLTASGTLHTPYSDHEAKWAKWRLSAA